MKIFFKVLKITILTVVIVILLFLFYLMINPPTSATKEGCRKVNCASNLKQIGLSLRLYSWDNSHMYPDKNGAAGFEFLHRNKYLTDFKIYTCSSSGTVRVAELNVPFSEENVSYIYIGGFSDNDGVIPIAFDKLGNHKDFVNVLFADGHVEGIHCKFTSYSQIIKMLKDRAAAERNRK